MNERITEDIVREHFKHDSFFNRLKIEEQSSVIPKINKLLKHASKAGTGRGKPDFIITIDDERDLLIVVECKADALKHESKSRDAYADYAVDGALLYSSFLSKEYDVLALAVSGVKKDRIRVSYFIQRKGNDIAEQVFGNRLSTVSDMVGGLSQDTKKGGENTRNY